MAFRPSLRRHRKEISTALNLNPLLDDDGVDSTLLANAQFAKIGEIELNLPPAIGAAQGTGGLPRETVRTLDLAVIITDQGFYISSSLSDSAAALGIGPAIPILADGEYDYQALSKQLYEIKQKVGKAFADAESVVIQAEPQIRYQILVSAMDAARSIRIDEKTVMLFPNVALSAGVI
jgi:biopolymer transport protein ExbD